MNFEHNEILSQEKTTAEIQEEKEQFKVEINEYKSLLEQLKAIESLRLDLTGPKVSLAFLIEEMKRKNPKSWQEDLKKFREDIDQAIQQEGEVGASWLIAKTISSAYIEFLERRKQEVQDEGLKRKVEIIKQMAEDSLEFRRKIYEQGQPVPFGGVSLDYVPKWYYFCEK